MIDNTNLKGLTKNQLVNSTPNALKKPAKLDNLLFSRR